MSRLLIARLGILGAGSGDPSGYESVVLGFTPAIYLKLSGDLTDSSGNGRSGTLNGSGETFGASSLPAGVDVGNTALDLGNAASLSIAHDAVDVALTFPASQPWTGGRKIADCTVSIWFKPNSLPTGSDEHVIVAKSSAETPGVAASYDGSWEAYIDENGAVHVRMRSFRGRPSIVRTPDSAVSAGNDYQLVVQLSDDGVTAWLDGAKFEDGHANLLHVYGLAADIRGTVLTNNFDWTVGAAPWGGQADLIVDEYAVYLSTLTTDDAQSLAESGSVNPLDHYIWSQNVVNESSFADIDAAIVNVNGLGGGTVLLDPGDSPFSENVTLLSNVRLKADGGTVIINGTLKMPDPGTTALANGSDDLLEGDQTLDLPSHGASIGDHIRIVATGGNPSPRRVDIRWNTTGESNDPFIQDAQTFEVESISGDILTFVGGGSYFDFPAAERGAIVRYTPNVYLALEGDIRFSSSSDTVRPDWARHMRFVGITTATTDRDARSIDARNCLYLQARDMTVNQFNGSPQTDNGGVLYSTTNDCIAKDCEVTDGRHAADVGGLGSGGHSLRNEFHYLNWIEANSPAPAGVQGAFGVHGGSADCIWWNCTSNRGGPVLTGWRHDMRWLVCGRDTADTGAIESNDGAGDSYLRDCHIIRPVIWFRAAEGPVGVDRNRFENITHSTTPTGPTHFDLNYGLGADVNTYTNVDTPSGQWQQTDISTILDGIAGAVSEWDGQDSIKTGTPVTQWDDLIVSNDMSLIAGTGATEVTISGRTALDFTAAARMEPGIDLPAVATGGTLCLVAQPDILHTSLMFGYRANTTSTAAAGVMIWFLSSGNMRFYAEDADQAVREFVEATATYSAGSTIIIQAAYTTNSLKIKINGDTPDTNTTTVDNIGLSKPLGIASRDSGLANSYDGKILWCGYCTGFLSDTDMATIADRLNTRFSVF